MLRQFVRRWYSFILGMIVYAISSSIVFSLGLAAARIHPGIMCLTYPAGFFICGPIFTLLFALTRSRPSQQKSKQKNA